jgi:hypothetical protein
VIELRLDPKGVGEGKASLTTKVVVDNAASTLALENYALHRSSFRTSGNVSLGHRPMTVVIQIAKFKMQKRLTRHGFFAFCIWHLALTSAGVLVLAPSIASARHFPSRGRGDEG